MLDRWLAPGSDRAFHQGLGWHTPAQALVFSGEVTTTKLIQTIWDTSKTIVLVGTRQLSTSHLPAGTSGAQAVL